ncbi:MAG TPA: LCP family protein [Ilumatobacter sp.]|nr:LCP family protein [Ilumatobacter sp.]
MSDYHDHDATRALDRLAAFEQNVARHQLPVGSPGLQLAGSIVVPGLPTLRRRPLLGIVLAVFGVFLPFVLAAWAFKNRADMVGFALNPRFLTALIAVCLTLVVVRYLAVAEVAHYFRRSPMIGVKAVIAALVVTLFAVPVVIAAYWANDARAMVADVFAGGSGESLYIPDSATDPNAITNVLLIGGDAGPGRWGMRTDTMIVVSVHEASGRTALVSVPRNLVRLQFPPGTPLAAEFPNGFTAHQALANAIFTFVDGRQDLLAHYGAGGLQPQAVALSEGIGYSLGIEIDDYALVNMQGFADVVDAVGGVTLDVAQRVPLPPQSGCQVPATIGPGPVDMDGCLAIAYVRSRQADSDYQRMQRQRQLLAALGSQVSTTEALSAFGSVTGVLGDSMRTSLTSGEFSRLLDRLGDNSAIGESVGLAPPLVTPGDPDYDHIKQILAAVENYVLTGTPSGYAS